MWMLDSGVISGETRHVCWRTIVLTEQKPFRLVSVRATRLVYQNRLTLPNQGRVS